MKSFAAEFVEGRRRGLERFLNRCAEHPLAAKNETFKAFLLADGDGLKKAKESAKKSGGWGGGERAGGQGESAGGGGSSRSGSGAGWGGRVGGARC